MLRKRLATLVGRLRLRVGSPGAEISDRELLERFADQRDEQAFAALVRRHGSLVLGVCRRLLADPHATEDAYQATFLVLARKAGSIQHHQALGSWLFRVAHRIAVRARAEMQHRQNYERQEPNMVQAELHAGTRCAEDPAEEAARREFRGLIDTELDHLPEKYRAPLVMCYLQGKTNEEAARELGLPAGSISRHLTRARELLQQRLVRRGIAFSEAALVAVLADTATAAVPADLQESVVAAALRFASGTLAQSQSVLWAEGALHVMNVTRIKLFLVLTATVGLLGLGASLALHQALAVPAEPSKSAAAGGDEKTPAPVREAIDIHGDPLPAGAVTRLGSNRYRLPFSASTVILTPDGTRVGAIGFMTNGLHWFERDTGRPLTPAADDWGSQGTPVFSPDGRLAVLVQTHYYAPPEARKRRPCHSLALWDVISGKRLGWLLEHRGDSFTPTFEAVVFTPDGRTVVAAGSDRLLRFWSVPLCKDAGQVKLPDGTGVQAISVLAVSGDSKTVAGAGADKQIRLWEIATARERTHFPGHQGKALAVRFDADGALLSVGDDGLLCRWDVGSGKELKQVRVGPKGKIACAAFGSDGRTVAAPTGEGSINLWDIGTGQVKTECALPVGNVAGLAFSADGRILASVAHTDQLVRLWDTTTGKPIKGLPGHANGLRALGWSPDSRKLMTGGESWDGSARLWDAATGAQLLCLQPRYGSEAAAIVAPDSRTLFSAGMAGTVYQWDAATSKEVRRIQGTHPQVWSAVLSPDGKTLALAGGGGGIILVDVDRGQRQGEPLGKDGWRGLSFSRDGKLLIGVNQKDQTARIWNLATRQETVVARPVKGGISGAALSPDGKWLASVSSGVSGAVPGEREDGLVRVHEVSSGKELFTLAGSERGLLRVAFSPDGKRLAAGGYDTVVRVWDVESRKEIFTFHGHTQQIECLAFSPDGRCLASGSCDSLAYVWNVADKR